MHFHVRLPNSVKIFGRPTFQRWSEFLRTPGRVCFIAERSLFHRRSEFVSSLVRVRCNAGPSSFQRRPEFVLTPGRVCPNTGPSLSEHRATSFGILPPKRVLQIRNKAKKTSEFASDELGRFLYGKINGVVILKDTPRRGLEHSRGITHGHFGVYATLCSHKTGCVPFGTLFQYHEKPG